jgi:hypothetical protein
MIFLIDGNCYCHDGNLYDEESAYNTGYSYSTNSTITVEVDMNSKRVRYFRDKVQLPYYISTVPSQVVFYAYAGSNSVLETISLVEVSTSMLTGDQTAVSFGSEEELEAVEEELKADELASGICSNILWN